MYKVWDFAMAYQVQKHLSTFEKQASGDSPDQRFHKALQP